jgi:DNA-directed RNA polymerase subunit L
MGTPPSWYRWGDFHVSLKYRKKYRKKFSALSYPITHTLIVFRFPNIGRMIVKVIELEKDKARLVIQGEGHTFMNALIEEILSDPDVDVARYMIEFQFSDPELFVTTKGKKNPLPIIKKACKRISNHCDELIKGLKKR